MAVSYPAGWVERVEEADKLALDPASGLFVSPNGAQAVHAEAIEERTASYLRAEAARRKKRLTKEDERLCRAFVLLAANWQTGAWDRVRAVQPPTSGARPARRVRSGAARSSTG